MADIGIAQREVWLEVFKRMAEKRNWLREVADRKDREVVELERQAREKREEKRELEAQIEILVQMATELGDGEAG